VDNHLRLINICHAESPTHTASKKIPFHCTVLYHIATHILCRILLPKDDEAPIPTETVSSNGPDMNRTVAVPRKAAKRALPFDLAAGELDLVSQDEDNPARKKLRLEEPLPARTDEAAGMAASPNVSVVGLLPPAADADHANVDLVIDGTTPRATGRWTTDENKQLTSAIANTSEKKWGNEYKTDWGAVAALVSGRTKKECYDRWNHTLNPKANRTAERRGKWATVEDTKLKDALQTQGDENWGTIAPLVPGRTVSQCYYRWKNALDPSIDRASWRTGQWAEYEDIKLKDAAKTHGDKNWAKITPLVPGRTKIQCKSRWKDVLDPSIDRANKRTGKWEEDEDSKLKDAAKTHGDKNWAAIAALVPGRTKVQCLSRWYDALDPSIDQANGLTGKWTAVEDSKLKDAVQKHGGRDWGAISALIPGRTKIQCLSRWHGVP
jgi:uncharacterized protein (DUF2237 family)